MNFINDECMYSLITSPHPSRPDVEYLRLSVTPLLEELHPYFYFTDARYFVKSLEYLFKKEDIISFIILDRNNTNIPEIPLPDKYEPLSNECKNLIRMQLSPNNDVIFVLKI